MTAEPLTPDEIIGIQRAIAVNPSHVFRSPETMENVVPRLLATIAQRDAQIAALTPPVTEDVSGVDQTRIIAVLTNYIQIGISSTSDGAHEHFITGKPDAAAEIMRLITRERARGREVGLTLAYNIVAECPWWSTEDGGRALSDAMDRIAAIRAPKEST